VEPREDNPTDYFYSVITNGCVRAAQHLVSERDEGDAAADGAARRTADQLTASART
jgi:hypothetical protein